MSTNSIISKLISIPARIKKRNSGESAAATSYYRAAEHIGNNADLWFQAAKALELAEDPLAEYAYAQAVGTGHASPGCLYRYGRFLETHGRTEAALDQFVAAEAAGGPVGHLSFRQARCRERLGDSAGAAAKFRRAAAAGFDPKQCFIELQRMQGKGTPPWLQLQLSREGQEFFAPTGAWALKHARLEAHMRNWPEATELFERILSERKLGTADILLLHRAYLETGEAVRAQSVLDQGLGSLPAKERGLGPGALFQKHGYWSAARLEYLRSLEFDAGNAELLYRIGLTYDREYKWAQAAEYFDAAFGRRPSAAYWAYKAGHAHERAQHVKEATSWYRAALRLDPSKKHWWYRLGVCLAASSDPEALTALDTASRNGAIAMHEWPHSVQQHLAGALAGKSGPGFRTKVGSWVTTALAGGDANLRGSADLIALAELSLECGFKDKATKLGSRPYAARVSLPADLRRRLAAVYAEAGDQGKATEVGLASRTVRRPDGFTLKNYLPDGGERRTRLYAEFVSTLPVDPEVVLLESNHGASAGCHPLGLFRSMLADSRFDGKMFVWAVNTIATTPVDVRECPRVRFVKVGSDDYLMNLATAGWLVNNVSFPPYFVRRESQRYLNTWHGTPMKSLGKSMRQGLVEYENLERNFIQASHLMAPNDLTKWALLSEHHLDCIYPGSVKILGSPRLDRLVNHGEELRQRIRERLVLAADERMVLVAPTWRGGVSSHVLDENALIDQLTALVNVDGVRVFYRAHRLTEKLVADLDLPVEIVPPDIDTNELLAAVDHLVTDYSSILFDFLVTGRSITLYVPDLDQYVADRGLYVMPSELPFDVTFDPEQLAASVRTGAPVDPKEYASLIERYAPYEDGNASNRCLDFFLSDELKGKELDGKPIVLFHGSMIPNGIASSLLAILEELVRAGNVHVLMLVEPKVLRRSSDRVGIFERLPQGVRLIPRLGEAVMSPEEYYLRGLVEGGRCDPGQDMLDRYWQGWSREARRITGEIPVTTAIEWDGYAVLWAGIMSSVGTRATRHLIWQHNDMVEEEANKYPELASVFAVYRRFDSVVSVSELLAETNAVRLGPREVLPTSGVAAVPNSLMFDEIMQKAILEPPLALQRYFGPDELTVVTIGRMSVEKNQEALIRAWPEVLQQHPRAKLLIVGSGPLEDVLAALIEAEGLQDSVILTGQLENPYPVIAGASLFILPSLHEGQPVVLFEAMALGVPVGSSACPGSLEAMRLGYGTQIPVDSRELSLAISRLLSDASPATGSFDATGYRTAALKRFEQVSGL